jgi:Spc7 kinetochore protein/Knl1 RWD C-terminal domain
MFSAAATTLPLLELYQHATRELKSYISTGRKIIRSIEAETLAEQPPLFREYIDARPDVKLVMDNQFRNGKTNARLQSKEGWYTWRTQLVDGLKSGLEGIKKGMDADLRTLTEQHGKLDQVVPTLVEQHETLHQELDSAREMLHDLESVDTEVLDQMRRELQAADELHASKAALLEELRQQMSDKEEVLSSAEELKAEMQAQIAEADKVRQEFRGWPLADVLTLKAKVDEIEKQTGWIVVSAEEDMDNPNEFGVALTLVFQNQLRLFFYPTVYQVQSNGGRRRSGRRSRSVSGPSAPISLAYSPVDKGDEWVPTSTELPTEKRFFLQLIRSQLQAFSMMPRGSVSPHSLLSTISNTWQLANSVSQEIRLLNLAAGITTASILSDDRLSVTTKLIRAQSRVDVEFTLPVNILNDGNVNSSTVVTANGVYGESASHLTGNKHRKVQSALTKEVEASTLGGNAWIGAIHAFERWLDGQVAVPAPVQKPEPAQTQAPPQTVEVKSRPAAKPAKEQPQQSQPSQPRSPLTTKKSAPIQRKALPVPMKRPITSTTTHLIMAENGKDVGKENIPPSTPVKSLDARDTLTMGLGSAQAPAIPPEMQEEMMRFGSPIRRVGALRRSPI